MVMWIVILTVVIVALITLGVVLGAGSRAARKRGMDRSSPAAHVNVVERPR
jgi:uncharacterized membrane protein